VTVEGKANRFTWMWLLVALGLTRCAPSVPAEPPRLRINQAGLEARLRALGGDEDEATPDPAPVPTPTPTPDGAVFRVEYGYVLLGRSTATVRRIGFPRLLYTRDDHDESFSALGEVDPNSISPSGRSLDEMQVTLFRSEGSPCAAQITDFKELAWAMPQDPTTALAWDEMPEVPLAAAIFERGNIYLVGVLTQAGDPCSNASWATSGGLELRIEEAQSVDTATAPDTIKVEPAAPYFTEWDAAYSQFYGDAHSAGLPALWQGLPTTFRIWGFPNSPLSSLAIVNFERYVTPELLGRANEPGRPWFSRGGVAVWQALDSVSKFMGPPQSVLDDSEALLSVDAIHVGLHTPLLSLSSSRHHTTLRQTNGQFEVAHELSMAPAP
jgi:hypothetical protein